MARRLAQAGPSLFDDPDGGDPGDSRPAGAVTPEPTDRGDDVGQRPDDGRASSAPNAATDAGPVKLLVRADGGSRGNPGPAAYGALVYDAATGELLDCEGMTLGEASNNVAEYNGLIAGLEMARRINPAAEVEVRMDSKLVVEQMAGRWKVKHPAMKPLASRAQALRPAKISWRWVPRSENKAADALVNLALDGEPRRRGVC
ncbi:MAG: reverse transcriptase-like protein [Propionibacteriaceae bacterium]|jgi:probable phosphoglycerate mutase|nr:reverse transcriptase-like protein [Propionibacteriaceae bacterium]